VASMLAALMAKENKRTILIDCNLKNPEIHRMYNLSGKGLSSILTQGINWKNNVHKSEIENLYILPAENYLSNTTELFSSGNMKDLVDTLRSEFEYIIMDTPPVNLFTDAQVLSPYVDGYLLVISFEKTKREDAIKAKTLIQYSKGKIIGVVLNKYTIPTTNMYYQRYSKAYKKIKGMSVDLKRRPKLVSSSNSDIKVEIASDTHILM
jgi:capsular exopolysaccharide synthesis family protein